MNHRGRLLSLGPALLVDAELLAVLLRVGIRAESALDIARDAGEREKISK